MTSFSKENLSVKNIFPAAVKAVSSFWKITTSRIQNFFELLQNEARIRFLTFLWSFVVIFISFHIIAGVNPFNLIVPGMFYQFPVFDQRTSVPIFAVSSNTGKLIPVNRKIYVTGKMEDDIRRLSHLISSHDLLSEEMIGDYNDREILPSLAFSIVHIWYLEKEKAVLIDLRSESIEDELKIYLKGRKKDENKPAGYLLDSYFSAFTSSIFSTESRIQSISYTINGKTMKYPNMKFDLSEKHLRIP